MKILSLQAENFKRLKAVEIIPDGNTVVIAGRNAQGKSSVLDAIWAALAGKDGVKEVSRPVRDGESKARVTLELDDLRVERKWTAAGSTLTVGPRDGSAKFNSPQAVLDKLIGTLSFDPLSFATSDAKSQVKTLIGLIGEAEAFDRIARDRKDAFEERTHVNRQVKSLQGALDNLPDMTAHGERVDVAALVAEIQQASEVAYERADLLRQHGEAVAQIAKLEEEIKAVRLRQEAIVEKGQKLPTAVDVTPLRRRLAEADEVNKAFEVDEKRRVLSEELGVAEKDAADLTSTISTLDDEKAAKIKAAALPVEGLSFDDDGVLYNGVPFQQASAAERLRVSVAMAMAMNPNIRVIRITDGSLLDSENLRLIEEMAAEKDFQVWIERVDESGEIGVVIEDGEVKA